MKRRLICLIDEDLHKELHKFSRANMVTATSLVEVAIAKFMNDARFKKAVVKLIHKEKEYE